MKYLSLFLFCLIANIVDAQITFEYIQSTDEHDLAVAAIELENGGFIISTIQEDELFTENKTDFIKLSAIGEVIQTQTINDTNYSYLPAHMQFISDTLHVIGSCTDNSSGLSFLWHCTIDNALEIIEQHIYFEGPDRVEAVMSVKEISNNSWVLTGMTDFSYDVGGIAAIISHSGELIHHKVYPSSTTLRPQAIMEQPEGGFLLKTSLSWFRFIDKELEADTVLSYLSLSPTMPEAAFHDSNTIRTLNDSVFIVSGRHIIDTEVNSNPSVIRIENLSDITAEHIVYTDTAGFPAIVTSLDFKYSDKIYSGGWQFNPFTPPYFSPYFSENPGWFILTQFDENLTPNWTRYYGGDAYYSMIGILATNDGGCLMYGRRYDASSDTGQDVYLLKVGPNGLLTSTITSENTPNITVYPNPTSNYIFFDTGEEGMYDVSFFDGLGKVIFQGKTPNNRPVDVRHLPTGVYTYVLEREGEIVSQGKWVKE